MRSLIERKLSVVCALVSASIILFSGLVMPINVLAETVPSAEQPVDQSIEPQTAQENIVESTIPQEITVINEPVLNNEQPLENTAQTQLPPLEPIADSTISNNAELTNAATQESISGNITATNNDDLGNSSTGESDTLLNLDNQANAVTALGGDTEIIQQNPESNQDVIINPQQQNTAESITDQPIILEGTLLIDNSMTIDNLVVVNSQSGSATLINNDDVGNVITGDSTAEVNVLNMANSIIGTGDVFVGTVTVYGDFNGDIVLSDELVKYLMQGSSGSVLFDANLDIKSSQSIVNDIDTIATSGNINADNNEDIGNVGTGNAYTFLLIKNFNGSFILYGNALLIIVNVLGNWDGTLLGQKDTNVGLLSANNQESPLLASSNDNLFEELQKLLITNNTVINNDITAKATTGDILLKDNDDIGNAQTGDSNVEVKILNIINSIVAFSDWVGVLFINIFGNWKGSVILEPLNYPTINVTTFSVAENTVQPPVLPQIKKPSNRLFSVLEGRAVAETPTPITPSSTEDIFEITQPTVYAVDTSYSYMWLVLVALLGGGLFAGQRLYILNR